MQFQLKSMPILQLKVGKIVNSLKHKGIKISSLEIGGCIVNLESAIVEIAAKDVMMLIEAGILASIDEGAKEPKPERPCEVCGIIFQPRHNKAAAKYCGTLCSTKARKTKNAANQKKHRDLHKEDNSA